MIVIPPPPNDWLEGQLLQFNEDLIMPRLPDHCADPTHRITREEVCKDSFKAHKHDRVSLLRVISRGKCAVCRHASGAVIVVSTIYVTPVTE